MRTTCGTILAVALAAHGIHHDAKHIHMKTEWLERILATAKECGVAVLGFDELQDGCAPSARLFQGGL